MTLWDLLKSRQKLKNEIEMLKIQVEYWTIVAGDAEKKRDEWKSISIHYKEQWDIAVSLIPQEVQESNLVEKEDLH